MIVSHFPLGPDGCNLFVFHIPNTMTNEALFRLFSKFGTVISARIMVEKATGRSRGFGERRFCSEQVVASVVDERRKIVT